jgi:hypothetical protein
MHGVGPPSAPAWAAHATADRHTSWPPGTLSPACTAQRLTDDPLYGEDVPLALYVLYELHYRGFDGVDDEWEWDSDLLSLRGRIERAFQLRLETEVAAEFGTECTAK